MKPIVGTYLNIKIDLMGVRGVRKSKITVFILVFIYIKLLFLDKLNDDAIYIINEMIVNKFLLRHCRNRQLMRPELKVKIHISPISDIYF